VVKTPPAAILIKKALGLHTEKKKGSGAHKPGKEKVGTLKRKQLEQIAKTKNGRHDGGLPGSGHEQHRRDRAVHGRGRGGVHGEAR